jgi:hypothetical protein
MPCTQFGGAEDRQRQDQEAFLHGDNLVSMEALLKHFLSSNLMIDSLLALKKWWRRRWGGVEL